MVIKIYNKLPAVVRYWLSILAAAISHWLASQAFIYAAALAFFTVFSIAPILVVVVALVGLGKALWDLPCASVCYTKADTSAKAG